MMKCAAVYKQMRRKIPDWGSSEVRTFGSKDWTLGTHQQDFVSNYVRLNPQLIPEAKPETLNPKPGLAIP